MCAEEGCRWANVPKQCAEAGYFWISVKKLGIAEQVYINRVLRVKIVEVGYCWASLQM